MIAQQDRMANASEELTKALMARAFDGELTSAAQGRRLLIPPRDGGPVSGLHYARTAHSNRRLRPFSADYAARG